MRTLSNVRFAKCKRRLAMTFHRLLIRMFLSKPSFLSARHGSTSCKMFPTTSNSRLIHAMKSATSNGFRFSHCPQATWATRAVEKNSGMLLLLCAGFVNGSKRIVPPPFPLVLLFILLLHRHLYHQFRVVRFHKQHVRHLMFLLHHQRRCKTRI